MPRARSYTGLSVLFVTMIWCLRAESAPINLVFETASDTATNEVAIVSFGSLADIITYSPIATQFSNVNVSSTYNIHGATWDGTAYRLLFETVVDVAVSEIAIASFNTLGAIIAYNPISTLFSNVNVSASFNIAGLTYDGSQYHLAFETAADAIGGNELAIVSFNAFNDLITYNPVSTLFSNVNISSTYNVHGFDFDGSLYHLLFETSADSSTNELAVVSFSSINDIITYNPLSTVFSNVNVSAAFNVAALMSEPDFGTGTGGGPGGGNGGGGGDPTPVPEPPTFLLLVAGLLAIGRKKGVRFIFC